MNFDFYAFDNREALLHLIRHGSCQRENSVGDSVNNLLTRKRLPSRILIQNTTITEWDACVVDKANISHATGNIFP